MLLGEAEEKYNFAVSEKNEKNLELERLKGQMSNLENSARELKRLCRIPSQPWLKEKETWRKSMKNLFPWKILPMNTGKI